MNQYPPLIEHASLALRRVCALRTVTGELTYGELADRCMTLRTQWRNSPAIRVGVWVDNSLNASVGIHALNSSGRSVALLRGCPRTQKPNFLSESGVDHVLNLSDWTLEPVDGCPTPTDHNIRWSSWGWDDPLFFVQTSGTTGVAQWLPLTTRQIHMSAFGSSIRLGHLPGDQWLNPLAPGYMGWLAVLTRCALYGTTMSLCDYHPSTVSAQLNTGTFTQVSLVPSMLSQMLESDPSSLGKLRTILVGGGPTPDPLLARCHALALPVVASWGMTEASSQVATQHAGTPKSLGHVGPPMPFVEVSVKDNRFVLSGPLLNQTLETRDVGYVDGDGQIHVQGRLDEMILSSGHKVLPNEVEQRLTQQTEVESICVFGIADETWGQLLCAAVVAPPEQPQSDWIKQFSTVVEDLPSRLKPRRVWQVDQLPLNQMYKPLRSLLSSFFLEFDQTMGSKLRHKLSRQSDGLETLEVDGRMRQPNARSQHTRPIDDVVLKDQGPITHLDNSAFNGQFVALPNGFMEVTLRVNEGQTHRMCVKELIPVAEDRKENFLEGDVGVFEDATEKNDSSAVNLVESGSKVVTKSHDVNLLRRKGKAKL